jgi:hypothetical protein
MIFHTYYKNAYIYDTQFNLSNFWVVVLSLWEVNFYTASKKCEK